MEEMEVMKKKHKLFNEIAGAKAASRQAWMDYNESKAKMIFD